MLKFILSALFLQTILYQVNAECASRWTRQNKCVIDKIQLNGPYDKTFPIPDPGARGRVTKSVNDCFTKNGCRRSSPIPNDQESSVRKSCFKDAKKQLDSKLVSCAGKNGYGWTPSDDYQKYDMLEWSYINDRVYDSVRNSKFYCNADKNTAVKTCVDKVWEIKFNKKAPETAPGYYCPSDSRCWGDVGGCCQDKWNRYAQPSLCSCSKRLATQQAIDFYNSCFKGKYRDSLPGDDPAPGWLKQYVADFCDGDSNHPCKSQRRYYDYLKSGTC